MRLTPITIQSITVKNNVFLAPLAGYTNYAFRRLCKEYGAGLCYTEMVSAKGLKYAVVFGCNLLNNFSICKCICCRGLVGPYKSRDA